MTRRDQRHQPRTKANRRKPAANEPCWPTICLNTNPSRIKPTQDVAISARLQSHLAQNQRRNQWHQKQQQRKQRHRSRERARGTHMNICPPRSFVLRHREDQSLPVCQAVHRLHEPFPKRPLAAKHCAAVVLQSSGKHLVNCQNERSDVDTFELLCSDAFSPPA